MEDQLDKFNKRYIKKNPGINGTHPSDQGHKTNFDHLKKPNKKNGKPREPSEEVMSKLEHHLLNILKKREDKISMTYLRLALQKVVPDYIDKELWGVLRKLIREKIVEQYNTGFDITFEYIKKENRETIVTGSQVKEDQQMQPQPPSEIISTTSSEPISDIHSGDNSMNHSVSVAQTNEQSVFTQRRRRHTEISDEEILRFLSPNRYRTQDVCTFLGVCIPTASNRLAKLQTLNLIYRTSRVSPWFVRSPLEKSLTTPSITTPSIEQRSEPVQEEFGNFEPNLSYQYVEEGGIIFSGLKHHKRIKLTASELIHLSEIFNETQIRRANKALEQTKS